MIIETMGRRRTPETYTKALLHFEGAVGSTTMTDETGKTWTPYGAYTYISDAAYKFGSTSARIGDPSGNRYISCSHDDFLYGANSFTIDFWISPDINFWIDPQTTYFLFSQGGINVSGGFGIQSSSGNQLIFWHDSASTSTSITYVYAAFNHIAIIGNGAANGSRNIKVYLNGVLSLTSTYDYNITTNNAYIGARADYLDDFTYSGYVDEFRISKGIQRWTSDFTPPTSAYTLD